MRLGVVWGSAKGPVRTRDGHIVTCPACGRRIHVSDIHRPIFCPHCGTQFSWDPVLGKYIIQAYSSDEGGTEV